MKKIALQHGSGNGFRDFGFADADTRQVKARLAGAIIRVLDERGLSVSAAAALAGFAAADVSRVRNARLERFTIDRLLAMLVGLDRRVKVTVDFKRRRVPVAKAA